MSAGSSAGSCGINSNGDVTVTGGTVTATGGTATGAVADSDGVYSFSGGVSISGGEVTATGGSEAFDVFTSVTVSPENGKVIEVKAGDAEAGAAETSGSPFTEETNITDLVAGAKYIQSKTSGCPRTGARIQHLRRRRGTDGHCGKPRLRLDGCGRRGDDLGRR